MIITLLDNFDSFTYNLVDQFRSLGHRVNIYRNDVDIDFLCQQLAASDEPQVLVLSPGPGAPHEAGCMAALIKRQIGKMPIIGICLGHQALVEHYGGTVERAPEVVHGKASLAQHNGQGIFANLPNPLPIARYHSLVATQVPECLAVIAEVEGLPMAVYHAHDRALGFQFHPESILTTKGGLLLTQALAQVSKEVAYD
ncbi:aminodeoxychorismate/anthranilate synthase component II [Shewanella sp. NIFS-20-20]|uniref:aminodeoxychorismate/anthranilate synthase component II n=1 Tax=Shewanella sp. NIFS-20-20 TaxID=2853806 RepID=UPI001C44A5F2|nr:aminodeoxychorismate/anthranilate synthase component II [Shewanella sp. NIFS-20-20]MBV7315042.1 aminodeoxychorismate/anthranilate synthase component II [Shewanella sp. NIFS-20-20]